MNIIQKSLLLLFLMDTLISCRNSGSESQNFVEINIEDNIESFKEIKLSDIADSVKYVPLETSNEIITGQITHLVITDGFYIVSGSNFCMTFNKNGRFLNHIGTRGHGPGQYLYIHTPSYDEKGRRIFLSTEGNKLLEFTVEGEFVRAIQLKPQLPSDYIYNSFFINDSIICGVMSRSHNGNKNLIYFFSEEGKLIKIFPNIFSNIASAPGINFSYSERILFKDNLSDTLYFLDHHLNLVPYYYFKLGKYDCPIEVYRTPVKSFEQFDERVQKIAEYIIVAGFFTDTKNFLLFTCDFGNNLPKSERVSKQYYLAQGEFSLNDTVVEGTSTAVGGVYNKNTLEVNFLKNYNGYYGFLNDIDGGMPFWPGNQPSLWSGTHAYLEELISIIEPYKIKAWIEGEEFKNSQPHNLEKKKLLEEMVSNLDLMDNPILMVVTLKN